jgi:large conductance mechanosensitive channel
MSFLKEFREFAIKGNFVDLAVGVIIGAASGKVVTALVSNVIMPPIGLVTGRVNFSELKWVLQPAVTENGKEVTKEVAIGYGLAIQSFIELLIIAFVVFLVVRMMNRIVAAKPAAAPAAQEVLLTEIRDILKAEAAGKPTKA